MPRQSPAHTWFASQGWTVFPFQQEAWDRYADGYSGIINAPTGFGKTYSLLLPILMEGLRSGEKKGLQAIWVSPIRALTNEIRMTCERAIEGLGLDWRVEVRSGDTSTADRTKQRKNPPQILITTPESIHVLMASKGYDRFFGSLKAVVVDEWHELMGSKRGVQMQLAMSRFRGINPDLKVWGISATIQNIDEALDVLLGAHKKSNLSTIIRSQRSKQIEVVSVVPDEIEKYPWAGHLGIQLLEKVVPIILESKSTIIFTNTRSQCEIWYQRLLDVYPDFAGAIAMHHGSIDRELRVWVEDALHEGRLQAVVSTSSLDLGVDFRPVETIVQVGSPKGVSRFVQRAGRSGHQPDAVSRIYFVPTHTLELIEGAALRAAIDEGIQEPRIPYIRSFDVLIQYLMTLAVSDGFIPRIIYEEIRQTHCYSSVSDQEWLWLLNFLRYGGQSLNAYDEYHKVEVVNGLYKVTSRRIARMHRLSIGTIVSDSALTVATMRGRRIGTIEESFISSIKEGDIFWFAGQALEFVRLKDMTVQTRPSKASKAKVPSWGGGRMPLSSMLSRKIQHMIHNYAQGHITQPEVGELQPLLEAQAEKSIVPKEDEFLIEYVVTKDGYHLLMYPFDGRAVHEGVAALLAQRIAQQYSITFSIAMNDYGFELLSDQEIDISIINKELFSTKNLVEDIQGSLNSVEMARRRFRDVAKISGLIFQGYPGKGKKERHLQSSASLLFDVFENYDADNLLYQQTFEEVLTFQLEEERMRAALNKIQSQKLVITRPDGYTPFSFPIIVDRLSRERLSSESMADRVRKMIAAQK